MTEEQVMDTIMLVVNRTAAKYTFYGYTVDDIKQEAFIICMDALDRYQEGRPLENFLAVHLSNRLKNFVRDNHFNKNEEEKAKVLMPGQLSNDNTIISPQSLQANHQNKIDTKDFDLKNQLAEYGTIYADILARQGKKDQTIDGQLEDIRYKEDSQQLRLWIWTDAN